MPCTVRRLRSPRLTIAQILAWADSHYARTNQWPTNKSGPVSENHQDTWRTIDCALYQGLRGLPCHITLAQLLERERGVRNRQHLPSLTEEQIVDWAQEFHQQTGCWPKSTNGLIPGTNGDTWAIIDNALRHGSRGLPGDDTLARLLARRLKIRNRVNLPPLNVEQILDWADTYFDLTGQWPIARSGPISESPDDTWSAVDSALRAGIRGLPSGSSLSRLLKEHRGVRHCRYPPRLTEQQILAWADAHIRRTGRWPSATAGPIPEAEGETWSAVYQALNVGRRGLPGGDSIRRILKRNGRVKPRRDSFVVGVEGQLLRTAQ
jgi:hypothetical protein